MKDQDYIELRDKHMTYSSCGAGGGGYMKWKGITFEHFDEPWEFFQPLNQTECDVMNELRTTIDRIIHLESIDVEPNTATVVWRWGWYKDLTKECKYINLIKQIGDIYHSKGKVFAVRVSEVDRNVVYIKDGKVTGSDFVEHDSGIYHYFKDLGMKALNVGQPFHNGLMYANTKQLLAFFHKNNFPTAI